MKPYTFFQTIGYIGQSKSPDIRSIIVHEQHSAADENPELYLGIEN